MYYIEKITKKRNENYNLYIQDYSKEKIEIHLEIIYEYKLHSKSHIEDEEFEELLEKNQKKLSKQYALKTLAKSSKTKKELISKLKQKRFSNTAIDYAMSFIDEYDFIDEENIAQNLVENKYKNKKYSKRKIQNELRQKGIDYEIINELTGDIDDEEEYENAMYFAKKKLRTISTKDKDSIKRRLGSALNYRGFNYSIIRKVIDEIINSKYEL